MEALVVLGSIGLFLVGMVILTDGLRAMAGDSIRHFLARFTTTPTIGLVTGALTTAIIQSSSATTVATVGFVSAGLLTFPQALGIILGANIGTTLTGWIVALVGFKLQLGLLVQPLVLAGVVLRLFGRGRLRHLGWALVGFGLLFIAIDGMKEGMAPWQGIITPDNLPGDSWFGRLQLVLLGIVITVITQSSSAGVAFALVALGTGTIALPQAMALVIGMDVGTTFTAALATLGGSNASRKTGYAHVVYNVMTGAMAFLLLDIFSAIAAPLITTNTADQQIALVAFHTTYNLLGAIIALPFIDAFARLIGRFVPERGPHLLRRLDEQLTVEPAVAVEPLAATLRDITFAASAVTVDQLDPAKKDPIDPARLDDIHSALEGVRVYIGKIHTDPTQPVPHNRHVAAVHILDHMFRLSHRSRQQERIDILRTDEQLRQSAGQLRGVIDGFAADDLKAGEQQLDSLRQRLREERRAFRRVTIAAASVSGSSTEETITKLDAVRWLHRVSYHYWRIAHHLRILTQDADAPSEKPETPPSDAKTDAIIEDPRGPTSVSM